VNPSEKDRPLVTAATRTAGVAGLFALTALAGAAPAHAETRSCETPRYPGSGYFTSLRVTDVGCRTGRAVTLAHYRCRVRQGAAGRCRRSVRGFRCRERRRTIATEINSVVTCRRGGRMVRFSYQQNR